jgi:hypothetical protein
MIQRRAQGIGVAPNGIDRGVAHLADPAVAREDLHRVELLELRRAS